MLSTQTYFDHDDILILLLSLSRAPMSFLTSQVSEVSHFCYWFRILIFLFTFLAGHTGPSWPYSQRPIGAISMIKIKEERCRNTQKRNVQMYKRCAQSLLAARTSFMHGRDFHANESVEARTKSTLCSQQRTRIASARKRHVCKPACMRSQDEHKQNAYYVCHQYKAYSWEWESKQDICRNSSDWIWKLVDW